MTPISVFALTISVLSITFAAINLNSARIANERLLTSLNMNKQQISKTIDTHYAALRKSLTTMYKDLETCDYLDCLTVEYQYHVKSSILKEYYALAECKDHLQKMVDIDRYMEARFVIASTLPIEKKKQLPLVQKNYYSVITEEINDLNSRRCVI